MDRRHHFMLVKVTKNKLTLEAIDLGGTVFDKYVLNKNEREAPYSLGVESDVPAEFLVCASDVADISECDFVADGVDDNLDIKRAISWCPQIGCTINLSEGTFHNTAFDKSDRIIVPSNTRIVFKEGTHLDFNGAALPTDRYVFDIDGVDGRVENVYIGGPGLITVNEQMDHGLRVKGDARDIVIGDGLRIEHNNPDISDDEGIQITGSVEVSDLIIREVKITGFGSVGGSAQGIELAGFVRKSLIEGFTSVANRHALALRGVSDAANGVAETDALAGLLNLPEASDKDLQTSSLVELTADDGLLVWSKGRFSRVSFELSLFNTATSTLSIAVSDGNGGWLDTAIVRDETSINGVPFAQSGEIEFVVPEDDEWSSDTQGEADGYWVRITTGAALDLFEIVEVRVHRNPQGNTISGLTAIDSVSTAIAILSASRNTFKDIVINSSGADGIRSNRGPQSGRSWANSFINVRIEGSEKNGYFFLNSPETRVEGGRLSGNVSGIVQFDTLSEDSYYGGGLVMENNRRKGIVIRSDRTTIENVIVRNNGADTSVRDIDRAGIVVMDGDGSGILNSEIIDNQEQPTQTYGVLVQEDATATRITENRIEGNAVAPIADFGTDTSISPPPEGD